LLKEAEVRADRHASAGYHGAKKSGSGREATRKELVKSNLRLRSSAYTAAHGLTGALRAIALIRSACPARAHGWEEKQMATFIVDGAARLADLIDICCLSPAPRPAAARCVDLQNIFQQAITNLSQTIEKNGAVVTNDPLPSVVGNEIHLVRLFQNLLSNAVEISGAKRPQIHVRSNSVSGLGHTNSG